MHVDDFYVINFLLVMSDKLAIWQWYKVLLKVYVCYLTVQVRRTAAL